MIVALSQTDDLFASDKGAQYRSMHPAQHCCMPSKGPNKPELTRNPPPPPLSLPDPKHTHSPAALITTRGFKVLPYVGSYLQCLGRACGKVCANNGHRQHCHQHRGIRRWATCDYCRWQRRSHLGWKHPPRHQVIQGAPMPEEFPPPAVLIRLLLLWPQARASRVSG